MESPLMPPPLPGSLVQRVRVWGFWGTVGWSLLIVAGYLAPQIGIGIVWAVLEISQSGGKQPDLDVFVERLESDGTALALGTLASMPFVVGLAIWFAWLRRGLPVREYLGLHWTTGKAVGRWCIYLLLFLLGSDAAASALGRPIVPDFMVDAYTTVGAMMPVLWIAVMVAAPLAEEFFFRGFLFRGLLESKLGAAGAIVVTAILWGLIHLQYDWYGIVTIVGLGILLGLARVRTGSLWLCVALHGLMNLIATVEVAVLVRMMR